MTSPPRRVTVRCVECGFAFEDWYRPSVNLAMDDFDAGYLREASTATCPECGFVMPLRVLIVPRWTG